MGNQAEESNLKAQNKRLLALNATLSDSKSKLESLLTKAQSRKEEFRKLLNDSQMANKKLALELADKNLEMTDQGSKLEEHKKEIKMSKHV